MRYIVNSDFAAQLTIILTLTGLFNYFCRQSYLTIGNRQEVTANVQIWKPFNYQHRQLLSWCV